jgi:hypothetical protein
MQQCAAATRQLRQSSGMPLHHSSWMHLDRIPLPITAWSMPAYSLHMPVSMHVSLLPAYHGMPYYLPAAWSTLLSSEPLDAPAISALTL